MPAHQVRTLAEQAGFSRTVLYRARAALESIVLDSEHRCSPHNRWTLTHDP